MPLAGKSTSCLKVWSKFIKWCKASMAYLFPTIKVKIGPSSLDFFMKYFGRSSTFFMKGNDPTNGSDGIEGGLASFGFFLSLHVFSRIAVITEITVKMKTSDVRSILSDENTALSRPKNQLLQKYLDVWELISISPLSFTSLHQTHKTLTRETEGATYIRRQRESDW